MIIVVVVIAVLAAVVTSPHVASFRPWCGTRTVALYRTSAKGDPALRAMQADLSDFVTVMMSTGTTTMKGSLDAFVPMTSTTRTALMSAYKRRPSST